MGVSVDEPPAGARCGLAGGRGRGGSRDGGAGGTAVDAAEGLQVRGAARGFVAVKERKIEKEKKESQ